MKTAARKTSARRTVALALTWDGARWPVRTLPPKARAFLTTPAPELPTTRKMATLLAADEVREIRVCWVPRLKGGQAVLADPFSTKSGKRLAFRATKTAAFGDVLGVIYRRV